MSENEQVTRAAGIVGAATLLSRIFGFVRDVVIAWFFGAGFASDAFFVAFRIPNLLRRLFAEGSLTISFIPVFTDTLANSGRKEALRLAGAAFRLLSVILALTAVVGMLLSPAVVRVIAPGFADSPQKLALTVSLTRLMFPYIFFIGLVALCMGILNALGHFAAPALAPVFLNLAMIASVWLVSPHLADPVLGLAVGVLAGGVLQLGLQLPFLVRKGVSLRPAGALFHPRLKQVGRMMLPAVFGAAVYQINILVGTLLASLLPEGSVSYLYYADRLVQFPLGIFAVAIATAVLPSLSRQVAGRDLAAARVTFAYALRLVFFITVPAMVGLIVLREPIVALLFRRGAFGADTVEQTAWALLFYAIGLWAFSAVRIVVSTFYALQDTRTPVRLAMISVGANIVFGIVLMQWLDHGGLALATSLASMLNFGLLLRALDKRLGRFDRQAVAASIVRTAAGSLAMGVAVALLAALMIPPDGRTAGGLFMGLFACILAGIVCYTVVAALVKSAELDQVWSLVKKRMKK